MTDPWQFWTLRVAGKPAEMPPVGKMAAGYYRHKNHAVGIWPDGDHLVCEIDGKRVHKPEDVLAERVFAYCAAAPITYELYCHVVDGGAWPEDITAQVAAERVDDGETKNHSEAILAEAEATWQAFEKWLASIGGKVVTEEHDAKVIKFRDAFHELDAEANEKFKAEKQIWLDGGRNVDNKWREARSVPSDRKKQVAKAAEAYRLERKRIADAETAQAAREMANSRAHAAAEGNRPPIPISVVKKPTGLRKQVVVVVVDVRLALTAIAGLNDPPGEILDAIKIIANRMKAAGIVLDGVEWREENRAT